MYHMKLLVDMFLRIDNLCYNEQDRDCMWSKVLCLAWLLELDEVGTFSSIFCRGGRFKISLMWFLNFNIKDKKNLYIASTWQGSGFCLSLQYEMPMSWSFAVLKVDGEDNSEHGIRDLRFQFIIVSSVSAGAN